MLQFLKRAVLIFVLFLIVLDLYLYNYLWFCPASDGTIPFDPQMEGKARVLRQGLYGKINNVLNDVMFKHIVSNVVRYWSPDRLFVLGDILSTQDLDDLEFSERMKRYYDILSPAAAAKIPIVSIAGNHDIGYSSEAFPYWVHRFENAVGATNRIFVHAGHLFVVLHSSVLDRARNHDLHTATWELVEDAAEQAHSSALPVILIMHIPLHKERGQCVDPPYTSLSPEGFVLEQNMLTPETSKRLLDRLQPVLVFTGHDHEGCYTRHSPTTEEYTVRSMMGDFSRQAALLEIHRTDTRAAASGYRYRVLQCGLLYTKHETVVIVLHIVAVAAVLGVLLLSAWFRPGSKVVKKQ